MKISVSDTGLDFIKDLKRSKKEENGHGADIVSEVDSEGDSFLGEKNFGIFSKSRLTGSTSRSIIGGSRRKIPEIRSPKNNTTREILKERQENNTSIKNVNEGRSAFLNKQNTKNSFSVLAVSLAINIKPRTRTKGSTRSRQQAIFRPRKTVVKPDSLFLCKESLRAFHPKSSYISEKVKQIKKHVHDKSFVNNLEKELKVASGLVNQSKTNLDQVEEKLFDVQRKIKKLKNVDYMG